MSHQPKFWKMSHRTRDYTFGLESLNLLNTKIKYNDERKWWTPNDNSTFIQVPEHELDLFEEKILKPYFDLDLECFKFLQAA